MLLEMGHYLHVLVDFHCVSQVMGIYIHETVENIDIWGNFLHQ